jgi:hypothetical protein
MITNAGSGRGTTAGIPSTFVRLDAMPGLRRLPEMWCCVKETDCGTAIELEFTQPPMGIIFQVRHHRQQELLMQRLYSTVHYGCSRAVVLPCVCVQGRTVKGTTAPSPASVILQPGDRVITVNGISVEMWGMHRTQEVWLLEPGLKPHVCLGPTVRLFFLPCALHRRSRT